MVTFGDASDSDGSIGITGICLRKQDDKLVFVALKKMLSLRTSAHAGVAIPLIFRIL